MQQLEVTDRSPGAQIQAVLIQVSDQVAHSSAMRWLCRVVSLVPGGIQTFSVVLIIIAGLVPMVLMGVAVAVAEKLCARRVGLLPAQYIGATCYLLTLLGAAVFSNIALVLFALTTLFLITGWFISAVPAASVSRKETAE